MILINHDHPECIRFRRWLEAETARGLISLSWTKRGDWPDDPVVPPSDRYAILREFNDMCEAPNEHVGFAALD